MLHPIFTPNKITTRLSGRHGAAQVNTGIEIKGYQEWFPRTSTYMCWIKPTFQRRLRRGGGDLKKESQKVRKIWQVNNNKDGLKNFRTCP